MQFLQTSISMSLMLFLSSTMASPSGRGSHEASSCPKMPEVQQGNKCSSGTPYCCSIEDGKNNCIASKVDCEATVICCNNDYGHQLCAGEINFNEPINIAVNYTNINHGDNISIDF